MAFNPSKLASLLLGGLSILSVLASLVALAFPALPVSAPLKEAAGLLLLFLLPLAALGLASRRRGGLWALAAMVLGFASLPLLRISLPNADDPGPLSAILSFLLVCGPLLLAALALLKPEARGLLEKAQAEARRSGLASAEERRGAKGKKAWAALVLAILSALLGVFVCLLAWRAVSKAQGGLFGVMMPVLMPYWAFAFLALACLSFRAARAGKLGRITSLCLALPALAAFGLALLPLADTPFAIAAAEREFRSAFASSAASWRSPLSRPSPFSLGDFFLGTAPQAAEKSLNVSYLRERASNGRDYDFRFDAWRPASKAPHPVLIRIHGGAWVMGDKGPFNMGAMNRYLASRGYAVFDIQYGLSEKGSFSLKGASEPTEGPFSLDDMVRQIGAFTSFLADHAEDYGADLSRVFVSGGSAGGQLVLATVLATSSGLRDTRPGLGFDPRLKVLGLIPFYPAVGLAHTLGVPGSPELDQPLALVTPAAPPALVYQGGHDGMVPLAKVRDFREGWRAAGAPPLAMIEFPFAGHGSDLDFSGPFNQVFLYYMESFMALEAGKAH